MSQAIVSEAQDGRLAVEDGAGVRVWLDVADARFVRDRIDRFLREYAERESGKLTLSDFREERPS